MLESSARGIRALKISLVALLATSLFQVIILLFTASVALLADTVHNFGDALTAIPLWVAFLLARRPATRRFTVMIAISAVFAAWESIDRLFNPRTLNNLELVMVAGVIGFIGNELVAKYRINVGKQIGSAALIADGYHARTDGFTSLAVVAGAAGVMAGFPLADPIVGLIISVAIFAVLQSAIRQVGVFRIMDGIDPCC